MQNKKQKYFKQEGVTLIGLLIGGAIIGITFTSGLTLISRNIRFSSVTAHEIAASALAEEGVELIRNIRDTGDNYYIKNPEDPDRIPGFEKIKQNDYDDYALDCTTDTYNATDILDDPSDPKAFNKLNAGLCLDDDNTGFYQSCPLSTSSPNLKFIRKINLLAGNPDDPDCKGVLVTATVYWIEFWEGVNWPEDVGFDEKNLHKVQIKKCMYDWRPR